jgi:hypothetical protein
MRCSALLRASISGRAEAGATRAYVSRFVAAGAQSPNPNEAHPRLEGVTPSRLGFGSYRLTDEDAGGMQALYVCSATAQTNLAPPHSQFTFDSLILLAMSH